jgi:hypothetical protein
LAKVLEQFDANAYAASVRVHAVKSARVDSNEPLREEKAMKTIEVYDKPMCCSTGVCGPKVDPVLPRFAADLDWLRSQGHRVDRFNLAQQPEAFIRHKEIHELVASLGTSCLPLIVVDGRIVSRRSYPSREMLTLWTNGEQHKSVLPVVGDEGGCCSGSKCC